MLFALLLTMLSCAPGPPLNEANIRTVDLVFVGEVISINDHKYPIVYEFRVIESFKGIETNKTILVSSTAASPGIHAAKGEKWLLVPNYHKKYGWYTSVCSNTGRVSRQKTMANLEFLRYCFSESE